MYKSTRLLLLHQCPYNPIQSLGPGPTVAGRKIQCMVHLPSMNYVGLGVDLYTALNGLKGKPTKCYSSIFTDPF